MSGSTCCGMLVHIATHRFSAPAPCRGLSDIDAGDWIEGAALLRAEKSRATMTPRTSRLSGLDVMIMVDILSTATAFYLLSYREQIAGSK